MILEVKSKKGLDDTCRGLEKAVADHGFNVMAVHDLRKSMDKHGVDFDRECRIFEICNARKAREVLYGDMRISTALPCRISVFEAGGVTLATLRPTAMLAQFDVPQLQGVAQEVEETIEKIMKAAAG